MPYKCLSEYLDVLEPPLQIPKPNKFKIIHMDIPIVRYTNADGEVKENMVFCADILDALTQDFFARKGNPIEEPPHVDEIKVGGEQIHAKTTFSSKIDINNPFQERYMTYLKVKQLQVKVNSSETDGDKRLICGLNFGGGEDATSDFFKNLTLYRA